MSSIRITNAKTHNLKDISINIPREKLVVLTGLSGSGKSSLAFDTIYAEGQRRYIETFSAYARQFLGNLERPDVDAIEGLSPVIAIEQKTTSRSPRSTVGTITEIYDFLRLLFARASDAYSPETGKRMARYTNEEIVSRILDQFSGHTVTVLSPIIRSRKGHYRELFETILKQGFLKVRVDGEIQSIQPGLKLDRYKIHDIEIVIDRISVSSQDIKRLTQSIELALKKGNQVLMLETAEGEIHYFSSALMCPESGVSLDIPEPNSFSFNSPKGMCPSCRGLGQIKVIDTQKMFPDKKLSIRKGGIGPLGSFKKNWSFTQIEHIGHLYNFTLDSTIESLSEEARTALLKGIKERITIPSKTLGVTREYAIDFDGLETFILQQYYDSDSASIKRWASDFLEDAHCTSCNGSRLKDEAQLFKIDGKS
ncbi:MAG: excinuclease ABC subunit UvrA, partial [Flavobacteriaceae bacterium]